MPAARAALRTRPTNGHLRIWQVASEVGRIRSAGGMSDAVHGLSQGLAKAGHRVTVVMPNHAGALQYCLREDVTLTHHAQLNVPVAGKIEKAEVFLASFPVIPGSRNRLNVFMIDNRQGTMFGNRVKVYGYPDDARRFYFFNRAVLELYKKLSGKALDPESSRKRARLMDFVPQLVHTHDWPTGFIPYMFRHLENNIRVGLVHNIHNLGYGKEMGLPLEDFYRLTGDGDPWVYSSKGMEFFDRVDHTKTAVLFADQIVAVSPTYAQEILSGHTPAPADLYAGILQTRRADVRGILNGLPDDYGPGKFVAVPGEELEGEIYLRSAFTPDDLSGKRECRRQLQQHLGLDPNEEALLLAFSGRWVAQKGIDNILGGLETLMGLPVQFAVIGSGDPGTFRAVMELNRAYPGRFRAFGFETGFDERLEALFFAGSDALLMPSVYEPCGLSDMKAQLFGSLPVVTPTGGLKDAVTNGEDGFTIADPSFDSILAGVERALQINRENPDGWAKMQKHAMSKNHTWSAAAKRYVDEAYREAVARAFRHSGV